MTERPILFRGALVVEILYDIAEKGWCRWSKRLDPRCGFPSARGAFAFLWERIHGEGSWNENPLVWVVSFARVRKS